MGRIRSSFVLAGLTTLLIAALFWWPTPTPAPPTTAVPLLDTTGGIPARWDCATRIGYQVNYTQAPAGAHDDVAAAIAELSSATGLTFADDGTTTVVPTETTPTDDAHPLRIVWATPPGHGSAAEQSDLLRTGDEAGNTHTKMTYSPAHGPLIPGQNEIVAADILLHPPTAQQPLDHYGGASGSYALILHELGHAVGLNHTDDGANSAMNRSLNPHIIHLSPADRDTLAHLYGHCRT